MADEAKNAADEQAKPTSETGTETPAPATGEEAKPKEEAPKPGEPSTQTVGEALGEQPKDTPAKPAEEVKMVPEAVFLELKSELKDLKKSIEKGDSKPAEISDSIKEIGTKYQVDPDFLQELASTIKTTTQAEFNKKLEEALEPYKAQTSKARESEIKKIFNEHFDKTLEAMPEYKGIVNKDVVETLARDPKNANKTFAKILEEAFGHLVKGKSNIDGAKPGSGKDIAEIDFVKAGKDTEYFNQIMASPELKKKYNDGMAQRNKL